MFLVDEMFIGFQSLCDNVCKFEFQQKFCENFFVEVVKLFERYMLFFCCENGKFLEFWVFYFYLVVIVLVMKRVLRKGDWDFYFLFIRNFILWCFVYDNINYVRYFLLYLLEIFYLEDEYLDVFIYLKFVGFVVQLGEDNFFGKILFD